MMYKIIKKVINKSINYLAKKVDHKYKAAKILRKATSNPISERKLCQGKLLHMEFPWKSISKFNMRLLHPNN